MREPTAPTPVCPRHHVDDALCAFASCDEPVSDKYAPAPICTQHVLLMWSTVELERQQSSAPTPEPRADRSPRRASGVIYYLRVGELIKVGFASNLRHRLMNYPPEAQLLAARPAQRGDEAAEHTALAAFRVHGREWYSQHPAVLARVDDVTAEHGQPEQPVRLVQPSGAHRRAVTTHGQIIR